ncbi:MAG: hypothetical protein IPL95_01705 [Saprospiraceae bacterium]|nr:hypothetical protein [Saprospiraceae bacterium]
MKYNFLALIFLFIIASCNNNQPNNSSTTATNTKNDKIIVVDNKNIQSNNVSQRNELATNDKKLVTKTKLHPITVPSKIENEAEESEGKLSKAQRIKESLEDEIRRTKDPATGLVPMGKFGDALEFTRRKQAEFYGKGELRGSTLANAKWKERGPTNVGGRVGTILVDKNDPTNKTLFVGHCSGGLWKTTDITATRPLWKPVNDYLQNLAVGGLVQDPTNPKIMYLGTGDPSADDVRGIGIFKSTDGGENWDLLPSTANKPAFYKTREIVIANDGAIYAACKQGVQKSTDGGNTWTSVLSNEIWDLEYIPSTNTLFASKNNSIWKSNTGNSGSWKNITSTDGFANLWQRTEFTVCQSSPNVIYAVGGIGGPNSKHTNQ